MRFTLKLFFTACCFFMLLSGCKKYPNGPRISIKSKTARIEGDWKIDKYYKNGTETTQTFIDFYGTDFEWHFSKDGKYHVHGNYTDEGTWKLGADKTTLHILPEAAGAPEDIYDIWRLADKELWITIRYSTGESETFHFKQ